MGNSGNPDLPTTTGLPDLAIHLLVFSLFCGTSIGKIWQRCADIETKEIHYIMKISVKRCASNSEKEGRRGASEGRT